MLSQIVANGIIAAATYALVGVGFAIVYRPTRFFHLGHGALFTAGAYFTFALHTWLRLWLPAAMVLAAALTLLMGCLMELWVFRRLRRTRASSMVLLLSSLGIYIVVQNIISMVFGDDTKSIRSGPAREGINVLGARITPVQVFIVGVSVAVIAVATVLVKRTRMGKALRAVANDRELAWVCGIDSDRVILWAFAVGSALAGVAGVLVALDVDMAPTMGMNALMMGVVAVIVGGVGSIPGIALGALLLGMAQHFGVWKVGSQWQDAIAFVILLAFLLFRPQGFLGREVRKATV